MDLSVCLREKAFGVRCGHWGGDTWFFPCGERSAVVDLVQDILDSCPRVRFLYLRREDTLLLSDRFPGRFRVEPAEDASEYLYDRREYVTLPGGKYQSIRWSINHLKKQHELRTEPLCAENLSVARSMLARWQPCSRTDLYSADHATADLMLSNMTTLGIRGIIVYVDGEAAALAAGFSLSERSFDIAFSKAPERETGLLHYARRTLVSSLPEQYTIINGEEDLGIPGLRQTKRLEHPMGQIEMWEAYAEE